MVVQTYANYSLTICLHVVILFTFLTIFFFAYVSKLANKKSQDALEVIINTQVGGLLSQIDEWNNKLNPDVQNINWNAVNKLAQKIVDNSPSDLPELSNNNNKLQIVSIVMIISLLLLLFGMYMYFKFIKGYDVNIVHIFMENITLFIFIGIVEYLFFTKIASKYNPVTPDFVTDTVLERVKYQVSHSHSLLEEKNK